MAHSLTNEEKCEFVRSIRDCHERENFIDYMNFLFCNGITESAMESYFKIFLMVKKNDEIKIEIKHFRFLDHIVVSDILFTGKDGGRIVSETAFS